MGLFSKKTVVCERCGKEYQVRITLGAHICDEYSGSLVKTKI